MQIRSSIGTINGPKVVLWKPSARQSVPTSGSKIPVSRLLTKQEVLRRSVPRNGPVSQLGSPLGPGRDRSGCRLVPQAGAAASSKATTALAVVEEEEDLVLNPLQQLLSRTSLPQRRAAVNQKLNVLSNWNSLCSELLDGGNLNEVEVPQLAELTVRLHSPTC